jgi:hypothetical protein
LKQRSAEFDFEMRTRQKETYVVINAMQVIKPVAGALFASSVALDALGACLHRENIDITSILRRG